MPDLSDLNRRVVLAYVLNSLFRGSGPSDEQARQYIVLFTRLTDKAVYEYEASRTVLEEYLASSKTFSLMLRSVDHLETCVHSIKRALRFLDQMNRYVGGPDIPKETHRLLRSYDRDGIKDIRDAIEHMDERIQRGEIAPGMPSALVFNEAGDAAEIADQKITFEKLAMLIRRMHALAVELSDYRESQ